MGYVRNFEQKKIKKHFELFLKKIRQQFLIQKTFLNYFLCIEKFQ